MSQPARDMLRQEAADWFARLDGGGPTEEEIRQHQAWLAASPAHRDAFEAVAASFALAGRLHRAGVFGASEAAAPVLAPSPPIRLWRAAGGTALAASLLLVAGIGLLSLRPPPATMEVATGIGEIKEIALADGSIVHLNAETRLSVDFGDDVRGLTLHQGEALFTVAKDPARPFRVRAGDRTIQAIGTVFDVQRRGDAVEVAVSEGRVLVAVDVLPGEAGGTGVVAGEQVVPIELTRGQSVSLAPLRQAAPVQKVALDQVGSWRRGLLYYESVPFSRVVADLNRSFPGTIAVKDAALADMPVTISFKLRDREATIQALEKLLPIRAERPTPNTILLVPARR